MLPYSKIYSYILSICILQFAMRYSLSLVSEKKQAADGVTYVRMFSPLNGLRECLSCGPRPAVGINSLSVLCQTRAKRAVCLEVPSL